MEDLVFTVPPEFHACALHADDNNGMVAPFKATIQSVIGPFDLEKGFAKTKSGEKYRVTIDAKNFKVTLK